MLLRSSLTVIGARPSGRFGINPESPQAKGLVGWWPIAPWAPTMEMIAGYHIQSNANGLYRPQFNGLVLDTTNVAGTHSANPLVPHTTRFTSDFAEGGFYWSFSCWVRPLTTTPGDCGVFSKWDGNGWMLYIDSSQIPRAYTGTIHADGATRLINNPDRWYLLTGTQDSRGAGSINIYVDGVLDGTTGTSGSVNSTCDIEWGNYSSSGGTPNDIQVADCRFYGRPLAPAEIWTLYDPKTRWDLYWVPSTRTHFSLDAAASLTAAQQIGIFDQQQSGAMVGLVYQ